MRVTHIQTAYLYEGLDSSASKSMMLWESAGFKLKEAALTADQIQQIFQSVEQGATAAGDNRTLLGKGKDAASAVNKAWEDLKTKIQDSGPIKNVDNAYDSAVAKIEQGLGGPDNAVSKMVMKYRKFAKEHPVAQGFIYAALIAAAGISGAGLGGAAVLGLLKMADKLLQGEKFSSAAYSGIKTGVTAFAASKLGDLIKGVKPGEQIPQVVDGQDIVDVPGVPKMDFEKYDYFLHPTNGQAVAVTKGMGSPFQPGTPAYAARQQLRGMMNQSYIPQGKSLSEGQVYMIFNRVSREYVMEGPMDALKGMAGKAADWAKTKGKNLTTKITADKLNSAWQKAGSPMDSQELATFLQGQGVDSAVVNKVYADLKLDTAVDAKAQSIYAQVKDQVVKLDSKSKKRIAAYLQKQLGTA